MTLLKIIKYLIIPTFLLTLCNFGAKFSETSDQSFATISKQDSIENINVIKDTVQVKKWLTKVITDYLNSNDLNVAYNNMRNALTDSYYNYRQDAINLEYGDQITEEEFHQKWKMKYDTKYVGKGGFFIPTQDHGTISIIECRLLNALSDKAQIYHLVIRDLRWKTDFVRDITVVSIHHKLFIDDIKEY